MLHPENNMENVAALTTCSKECMVNKTETCEDCVYTGRFQVMQLQTSWEFLRREPLNSRSEVWFGLSR